MRFALVNMPLFSCNRPSIQLARIQAQLKSNGVEAESFFPNVYFAHSIGATLYNHLSDQSDILFGHWVFASAVNEIDALPPAQYLETFKSRLQIENQDWAITKQQLLDLREKVAPAFIEEWGEKVHWQNYDYVGFTCTFSQLVASLALAKEIKRRHPTIKVVLGGAEVQSSMGEEIMRHCSYVDHIVQGEGDYAVLKLLETPSNGILRDNRQVDLSSLPTPDYTDFFHLIEELNDPVIGRNANAVPIEGSRGCWWGQKHHCTFCGLNGEDLRFRSRTVDSILSEIAHQSDKHERYDFEFVDNILDHKYFKDMLPRLTALGTSFSFFAEIKSNVRRTEVESLRAAGFHTLQPGIESLSSPVLKIMKKGVSAVQNLELLKWGAELGVNILWNVLYGFPDENDADYVEMIELIEKIPHLQPPQACGIIRLDRFSPYFNSVQNQTSPYFEDVAPAKAYSMIYPKSWAHWDLAYFFEGKARNTVRRETYELLAKTVSDWKKAWQRPDKPSLIFKQGIHHGHVIDRRAEVPEVYKLDPSSFAIAKELVSGAKSVETLAEKLNLSIDLVREIVHELLELDICVRLDGKIVFLPIASAIPVEQ